MNRLITKITITFICFIFSNSLFALSVECKLSSLGVYPFKYYITYQLPSEIAWGTPKIAVSDKKGMLIVFTPKNTTTENSSQQVYEAYQTRKTALKTIYQEKVSEMKTFCKRVNNKLINEDENSLTFILQYSSCQKGISEAYMVSKIFHADGTYVLQYFANPNKTSQAERTKGENMIKQATLAKGCLLGGITAK